MFSFYLEYKIINNRPGLLGNVASLLGLLKINILTIASIEDNYRGLLIEINKEESLKLIINSLNFSDDLMLTALRKPDFIDILALKHGKKIKNKDNKNYYIFYREDLDILIDFLSEYLKINTNALIGFKGSPRIGKTETAIAAAVHANKRWQLLSSTLLRKIAITKISKELLDFNSVFIIDAITTFHRSNAEHIAFVNDILKLSIPRIIEHPEVLIQESEYLWDDFDLILELRDNNEDAGISRNNYIHSYNSFDIS